MDLRRANYDCILAEQSDPGLAANASPCRKDAKPENGYWFYNAGKQMFQSAAVR
jgi:hypothetical protein